MIRINGQSARRRLLALRDLGVQRCLSLRHECLREVARVITMCWNVRRFILTVLGVCLETYDQGDVVEPLIKS